MSGNKSLKIPPKTVGVSVKKKEEGVHDLEQQFLLRLPPGPAMALRRDIQSASMNLKDRLSIELQADLRRGRVTYGGYVFNAKLMDLPTIIESLKTLDRKSLYKTADICQMLRCTMDDEDDDSQEEADSPKKKAKEKEKKYQWNHGISPGLKNVRKRRFRKTLKKKYQEQPDIEKEVKRLFRMDNEAIDVKWEEVIEEHKPTDAEGTEKQVLAQGGISGEMALAGMPETSGMLETGDMDLFGELSSSDDEDEDEKDINIMDSGDEDNTAMSQLDMGLLTMSETNMSADGQEGELQQKLEELARGLEDVRERRLAQELELSLVEDIDLKTQMEDTLNLLAEEENKKKNEYEILYSMLSQS